MQDQKVHHVHQPSEIIHHLETTSLATRYVDIPGIIYYQNWSRNGVFRPESAMLHYRFRNDTFSYLHALVHFLLSILGMV